MDYQRRSLREVLVVLKTDSGTAEQIAASSNHFHTGEALWMGDLVSMQVYSLPQPVLTKSAALNHDDCF